MKRNARLMILIILALFLMPFVLAYATPLESFAENPIPYWVNGSSEGINVTHDSDTATVLIDGGPHLDEDMSTVTNWEYSIGGSVDSHSMVTNGSIANLTATLSGSGYCYYKMIYSTVAGQVGIFRVRNHNASTGYVGFRVGDAGAQDYITFSGNYWQDKTVPITDSRTIIQIGLSGGIAATYIVQIDYILLEPSTLSLAVPLESDTIQSIEFMGNFSALNSTVRFNITASLFCDVNSTQVTFPDSTYAEFTNFARINFTLDEERIIFKIYVFALNMTLINSYSSYVGPANNDYLFMTDSEFEGSYTLLYLQGDIGYLAEVIDTENIFYLLFLSLEMWGYLGPVMLVIVGYFLADRDTTLGILWFIVECLFVAQYLDLVGATPNYWWHLLIILFGGLVTCIFPAVLKRR